MRVLVTGDRDWGNPKVYGVTEATRQAVALFNVLSKLFDIAPDTIIVEGDARGADKLAGQIWAELTSPQQVEAYPADWNRYHRAAGPIRNREMLKQSIERGKRDGHTLQRAIACHSHLQDSKGTKDMVKLLQAAIGDEHILYVK
jgi:hypothetical protein